MRVIFIALIFFAAGCSNNDKETLTESAVTDTNVEGEQLYKNCVSCHKPGKEYTGPILKGALKRWGGDKKAMYAFIRNPMKSVTENEYAKKIFEKWKKTTMTAFPNLTDSEIDAIMNYFETLP